MTNEEKLMLCDGKIYNGIKNYKSKVKGMGSFFLVFENSANFEYDGFYGVSHLIEHCMCEKIKEMELDFERYGIKTNASTDCTRVKFYIAGLDEGVIKFRKRFYDEIINYEITEDVFERERKIVLQEYNDSLSDSTYTFLENVSRKYFGFRLPIGERSDLLNLTYQNFLKYKNCYFSFPTYICNTSSSKISYKNNDFITIKKNYQVADRTNHLFDKDYSIPLVNGQFSKISSIVSLYSKINYGFFDYKKKKYEYDFKKLIYYTLFSKYLTYGLSAPLYKELREGTGEVYSVSSNIGILYKTGNGVFKILVFTNPERVNEIKERLMKCLEKEIKNPNENIFNNVLIGFKNEIKKNGYLSYINTNSFIELFEKKVMELEFSFDEFKNQISKLISDKNDYILIDDKNF